MDKKIALEVKISDRVDKSDIKGLLAFQEEYAIKEAHVVCLVPRSRKMQITADCAILIWPWQVFLKKLWAGDFIK